MSAMIGAFPSIGMLCQPQASADLTDDDHDLALSGWEVIEAHKVIEWAIKTAYPELNSGATISLDWFPKLRRSANRTRARFANETRARNSEPITEEFPLQGDRDGLTAAEAAMEIGISVQYCRRIRHKIGGFRIVGRSIIFEPQAVADYKLRHPSRSRSRNAEPLPRPRQANDPGADRRSESAAATRS
jgi:hypothetical protein